MSDISLRNITRRFGATTAVDHLSLDIADGEFVVLLGPTGAGKTTTLRLVAGLEKPDEGQVYIGGESVSQLEPAARDVTFVFQQYSLYPHLSVYENLAFPLRSPVRRLAAAEIDTRVKRVAEMLRIQHKLKNKSTQLSGGEMQRVAIGRALVRQPSIYLMDEPLSSLDAKLRGELRLELKRIQQELGATILYVTHDQIEAMTMANRIGVIDKGKLLQIGTPREMFEDPNSAYVAQRLGQPQINLLPAGALPNGRIPNGAVTVGARTEHLDLAKSASGEGVVEWVEHLGDQIRLHVKLGPHEVMTLVDPDSELVAGDRVAMKLRNPLYFDSNGARLRS
ncbi:MAG: ABC transporter ATP-binding protein [Rhizobiales bacterium]|nr:ABC transporter ATP-binding protein [Hyphomicrobiales bacterium]